MKGFFTDITCEEVQKHLESFSKGLCDVTIAMRIIVHMVYRSGGCEQCGKKFLEIKGNMGKDPV